MRSSETLYIFVPGHQLQALGLSGLLLSEDGPGGWVRGQNVGKLQLFRAEAIHDVAWSPLLYEAECLMDLTNGNLAVDNARLVRKIEGWNERALRIFACDCVERAVKYALFAPDHQLWDVVDTARKYAEGTATAQQLAQARALAQAFTVRKSDIPRTLAAGPNGPWALARVRDVKNAAVWLASPNDDEHFGDFARYAIHEALQSQCRAPWGYVPAGVVGREQLAELLSLLGLQRNDEGSDEWYVPRALSLENLEIIDLRQSP